jgi:hypothetical protein
MLELAISISLMVLCVLCFMSFRLAFKEELSTDTNVNSEDLLQAPMVVLQFDNPTSIFNDTQTTIKGRTKFEVYDQDGFELGSGKSGVEITIPSIYTQTPSSMTLVLHYGELSSYSLALPTGGHLSTEILS